MNKHFLKKLMVFVAEISQITNDIAIAIRSTAVNLISILKKPEVLNTANHCPFDRDSFSASIRPRCGRLPGFPLDPGTSRSF